MATKMTGVGKLMYPERRLVELSATHPVTASARAHLLALTSLNRLVGLLDSIPLNTDNGHCLTEKLK